MRALSAILGGLALGLAVHPAQAADGSASSFESWKSKFVSTWAKREVPPRYLRDALREVMPDPKVIAVDRNQITASIEADYPTFMKGWLETTPPRIARGRELLREHAALLERVERKYGVDREAIVALWGVETLYGAQKGEYDVVRSLATLAFEGRRRKFFETQLFTAIKILHRKHVRPEDFTGSWSGAMGHCQFMPTSYEMIAVDFDGDGRKDIWNSLPDTFATMANYLRKARWVAGKPVGRIAPSPSPGRDLKGAAEIPLRNSPVVFRGENYLPVMRWNNSALFAAFMITLMEGFRTP
ncbi:MAG: lytic murein transglycosylase [Bdellovibrionales bacterium]|nr:lytic murein transglycosylase [Bdellovibrionales bacterium]